MRLFAFTAFSGDCYLFLPASIPHASLLRSLAALCRVAFGAIGHVPVVVAILRAEQLAEADMHDGLVDGRLIDSARKAAA